MIALWWALSSPGLRDGPSFYANLPANLLSCCTGRPLQFHGGFASRIPLLLQAAANYSLSRHGVSHVAPFHPCISSTPLILPNANVLPQAAANCSLARRALARPPPLHSEVFTSRLLPPSVPQAAANYSLSSWTDDTEEAESSGGDTRTAFYMSLYASLAATSLVFQARWERGRGRGRGGAVEQGGCEPVRQPGRPPPWSSRHVEGGRAREPEAGMARTVAGRHCNGAMPCRTAHSPEQSAARTCAFCSRQHPISSPVAQVAEAVALLVTLLVGD